MCWGSRNGKVVTLTGLVKICGQDGRIGLHDIRPPQEVIRARLEEICNLLEYLYRHATASDFITRVSPSVYEQYVSHSLLGYI